VTLLRPVFVQVPFSLYHGWTVVLVVLSGFEAFGIDARKHKLDVLTKALAFVALFFLEATGAGYALYFTDGDLAGSSVITWTLWGIYDNQKNGGSLCVRWGYALADTEAFY
jgi:hypothetical protein